MNTSTPNQMESLFSSKVGYKDAIVKKNHYLLQSLRKNNKSEYIYISSMNWYEYTQCESAMMHIIILKYLTILTMEGSYVAFGSKTDSVLVNKTHNTCAEKDRSRYESTF